MSIAIDVNMPISYELYLNDECVLISIDPVVVYDRSLLELIELNKIYFDGGCTLRYEHIQESNILKVWVREINNLLSYEHVVLNMHIATRE
jgi:hypothetical protein